MEHETSEGPLEAIKAEGIVLWSIRDRKWDPVVSIGYQWRIGRLMEIGEGSESSGASWILPRDAAISVGSNFACRPDLISKLENYAGVAREQCNRVQKQCFLCGCGKVVYFPRIEIMLAVVNILKGGAFFVKTVIIMLQYYPIRPSRVTLGMGREMPQDDANFAKTSMQASTLSTSFDRKTRCPKISSLSLVNAYYIIGFPGF
ncbi:hypothetical protein B0H13DRAFT_1907011 [Mycena leptocephala]|nr:hypothetical protein B0H13DRAFT_1907011 [Mycena leptocephala]